MVFNVKYTIQQEDVVVLFHSVGPRAGAACEKGRQYT